MKKKKTTSHQEVRRIRVIRNRIVRNSNSSRCLKNNKRKSPSHHHRSSRQLVDKKRSQKKCLMISRMEITYQSLSEISALQPPSKGPKMLVSSRGKEDNQINYKLLEVTRRFAARSSMKILWMNFVFSTNLQTKNTIRMQVASRGLFKIKRRLTNNRMSPRVWPIPASTKRKHPKIMPNKRSYSIRQIMTTLNIHNIRGEVLQTLI